MSGCVFDVARLCVAHQGSQSFSQEKAKECKRFAIKSQAGFSLRQMWDQCQMRAMPKGWIGAEGGNDLTLLAPVCLCTLAPRASDGRNTERKTPL